MNSFRLQLRQQGSDIRHLGRRKPIISPQKMLDCELLRMRIANILHPLPLHPPALIRPRSSVLHLRVEARVQSEIAQPWQPTVGMDDRVDKGLDNKGPGKCLPWPAEVGRVLGVGGGWEGGIGGDGAVVEDDGGGRLPGLAALCGDDVLLVVEGLADEDLAVLEDGFGVAEDEVDGAGDGAVAVELAEGVDVEGVLVRVHLAVVEDGAVGLDEKGDGLVFRWAGGVLEPHVPRDESLAHYH